MATIIAIQKLPSYQLAWTSNTMIRQREMRFSIPDELPLERLVTAIKEGNNFLEQPEFTRLQIHLDSFDWRLYSAGVSLWTQKRDRQLTIHQSGIPQPPISSRSAALQKPPKFPTDLPLGTVRDTVSRLLKMRALLPRVETRVRVITLHLLDDDEKTVLRIQIEQNESRTPGKGDYTANGNSIRLLEVRGYPKAFTRMKKLLDEKLGLSVCNKVPLDLALSAIGKQGGDYSSKLSFSFNPKMRSDDAAKQIHLHLIDVVEVNVPGVKADIDSEFLHDMRVAVRRTRSALSQIKGVFSETDVARFKSRLAWVGEITGPTRDMDVYLLGFDQYRDSLPQRFRKDLDPLHDFLEQHQKIEHLALVKKINSPHFRKLIKEWRIFLKTPADKNDLPLQAATPVAQLASRRIHKMFKRVLKEGQAITADSPAENLHDLRKDCKKLRYLMEFFQSLYPTKKIALLIVSLKMLLDNLGNFQDLEVQADKLRDFARQMCEEANTPHDTLLAMGMLVDGLLRRQQQARIEFAGSFGSFSRPKNQQLFQDLFAAGTNKGKS